MSIITSIKLLSVSLMLALLASCSCSNNAPLRDLVIPEITSTTPSSNAKNAVINTFIHVNFSEKMNAGSIHSGTFRLFDSAGNPVNSSISYSGTSATLKPSNALNKTSTYAVELSRDIKDVSGNQIIGEYVWQFTTGTESDILAPVVESVLPTPYSKDISLDTQIIVTLDKPVSSFSVVNTSFKLENIEGAAVEGSFTVDGFEITFDPIEDLAFDSKYTLTLTTDIQDLSGNGLSENYITQFTTVESTDLEPPRITAVSPGHKSTDIPLNTDIIISFNEDIDANSVSTTSLLFTPDFSKSFSVSGANIIISPDSALSPSTEYRISAQTSLTDIAGNALQASFDWVFFTGSNEDKTRPTITYVNPENDATNVTNNNAIVVTFSEAINPSTLFGNISLSDTDTTIHYSGNTAILRPTTLLGNNKRYTVLLLKNITDLAGNPLLKNYSWQFTTGITADREIPSVTSVYPQDASNNVAINSAIVVRFSEAMDPISIHANSFIVTNTSGESIVGVMKTVGASVTFHPLENFAFSENYTVTINKQATDLASNALANNYVWQFTTSSEKDEIRPTILSTVPASSSNFAPTNRGLIVTFSEVMDLGTLHSGTFFMTDTSGTPIPGNINHAENTISFLPNEDLNASRSYIATVSAEVADMAGNRLGLTHSWSFTTSSKVNQQAPAIISTLPADGAKALVNSGISINFDKNMDPVSLNSATIFMRSNDGNNQVITGTVNVGTQSATFFPLENLAYETPYSMTVTTGVRDLAKNSLAANYSWSFTTTSTLDKEPPFVISVTPFDAQEKVSLISPLSVVFSEALDCSTLNSASFNLTQNSISVPGVVSCNGLNASFTPSNAFATNSPYVATLATSITDLQQSTLTEVYSWQFFTAPWTQQFGSINRDFGETIALDDKGNVFTAGSTEGSLAGLNKGVIDLFITKHSKNSLLLWSKQMGTTAEDYITDIINDSDGNIYLAGYSYGNFDGNGNSNGSADMIIIALDSEGQLLWQKQMGTDADDIASAIQLDADNNLIVAGYSFSDFDGNTSNGLHDIVVMKLSTSGTKIWSQQFGSINFDISNDLAIDNENNIYVTGYTEGILSGPENFGFTDIILTKLDSNSNILWTQQIGTDSKDEAEALAIDSNNHIYLSGFTSKLLDNNAALGGTDQFTLKYDKAGNLLWSKQWGTNKDERATGITVDTNDDIIITGYTAGDMDGENAGDNDISLIKLAPDGRQIWVQQLGTEGSDLAFDVSHDDDNNLYVVGRSEGELDGNRNAGDDDVIIIKWNEAGVKQ